MSDTHTTQPVPADDTTNDPEELAHVVAHHSDPDADWAYKTANRTEGTQFFGYYEHTLVQVPHGKADADLEPTIIRRLALAHPKDDLAETTLDLLDRLPTPATDVIVDRAYSHKVPEKWRDRLAERGISQHFDLRIDEQGFTDQDSLQWAAGHPHCPMVPRELGVINKPNNGAPEHKITEFKRRLKQRLAYAFRRVTTPDNMGKARWECPAAAGKIGCPLVNGTVQAALELGLPQIENPPNPEQPDFPTCCSQRTVTLDPGKLRKQMQDPPWGDDEWDDIYDSRTYVEGSYGNRTNSQTENTTRGHIRATGIEKYTIFHALGAAMMNLRMTRNWHDRTGLGPDGHPLLEPAETFHGFGLFTAEDATRVAEQHRPDTE